MRSQILILGLHRVGLPPAGATHRGLFTTPRLLDFQIRFVKMLGFKFVTLKEALEGSDGKRAVITFDDGYQDNFSAGLPVLEKHNVPATVFVITGDVAAKAKSWDEAGEKLPADLMNWDEIKTLSAKGWEIGSHAHDHIHLARHTPERQEKEITRSIRDIEENIGETPVSFAYPYGSYCAATKEILMRSGIRYAVTINNADKNDPVAEQERLELSRVSIGGRLLHHYVKSVIRTLKATGLITLFPRPAAIFSKAPLPAHDLLLGDRQ
ncbi:MAG: polysaccharide deacetylase family protein [Pyrinomonadaceae bacterium]